MNHIYGLMTCLMIGILAEFIQLICYKGLKPQKLEELEQKVEAGEAEVDDIMADAKRLFVGAMAHVIQQIFTSIGWIWLLVFGVLEYGVLSSSFWLTIATVVGVLVAARLSQFGFCWVFYRDSVKAVIEEGKAKSQGDKAINQ